MLITGCSGAVDEKAKELLDSQTGLEMPRAGTLTLEQVLQTANWDLEGQPLSNAKAATEETCIAWQFNHIDNFRVNELGVFILKKGLDETIELYSSVQDCSTFLGTLQLYFEQKNTRQRYLISSIERKASANRILDGNWVNFDDESWSVKHIKKISKQSVLYITESEIEIELSGEGLSSAKKIRVGDSSCSSSLIGCWAEYPIQNLLTVRLPKLNTQYNLRLWLLLENGQTTNPKVIPIWHDNVPPNGGKIVIKDYLTGSTEITRNAEVSLNIRIDNPESTYMYITNDGSCDGGGEWRNVVTDTFWTLRTLNGRSYVYVKFRDYAQNETECLSASILHDSIPPVGSVAINFGASVASSTSATISISSSGAEKMRISNGSYCSTSDSSWETVGTQKSWTLVPYQDSASVSVKFKDNAGNESTCQSATITTPYVYLQHKWLEGSYQPRISTYCYPTTRDYRILNSKTVQYPPFTNLALISVLGCAVSKISNTDYVCDHTVRNLNCVQSSCWGCLSACSGRDSGSSTFEYPTGWLTCNKPSSVPR
jgi:hypothetical protein